MTSYSDIGFGLIDVEVVLMAGDGMLCIRVCVCVCVCVVASGAPLQEVCRSHSQLVLSGREGYISNKITEATYCGGVRNPWIVKGQPGQVIYLS